jgi:hypothetical protein
MKLPFETEYTARVVRLMRVGDYIILEKIRYLTANKSSTFTVSKLSILILTYPRIIDFRQSNTQIHDKNHSLPYMYM